MGDVEATPGTRGALTGAMIAAMFGIGWTQWAASGVTGAASDPVRVAGIAVGLVIFPWSASLWRAAPRTGYVFSSPAYRIVVALMVVALIGGNALLRAVGQSEYIIASVATVVGIHFLAFGRLFWAGFYRLGTALIAAGIAGAIVGLAGGGSDAIEASTGLIAAASLFVAGGSTVARARGVTSV